MCEQKTDVIAKPFCTSLVIETKGDWSQRNLAEAIFAVFKIGH